MPKTPNGIRIARIGLLASITAAVITGLFLFANGSLNGSAKSSPAVSTTTTDSHDEFEGQVNQKTENGDNSYRDDHSVHVTNVWPSEEPTPPNRTPLDEGKSNEASRFTNITLWPTTTNLEELLESKYRIRKAAKGSESSVEIGYSGDIIESTNKGLYQYNGGCILISVNDQPCHELRNFPIGKTDPIGNSREWVQARIEKQIENMLKDNEESFAEEIAKCLK